MVIKILKSYKVEINPTIEQKQKIDKTINTCRFIYNFYLGTNIELYRKGEKFLSAYDFSKWLNNDFIPNNFNFMWIKEVSTKSVSKSIQNGEVAFKNFFNGKTKFPKFKKKNKSNVTMYFVKNSKNQIICCERHRIKIPTLGWVKLKQKGYIPTDNEKFIIKSGNVSKKAGRYYVSVLVESDEFKTQDNNQNQGIGIDLGIKEFVVCSDGIIYENINKTDTVRKLEKRKRHLQRKLSNKYELNKQGNKFVKTNNIIKLEKEIDNLNLRLYNIRHNYLHQVSSDIIRQKPSFIVLENLNVKGMLKNKHLSKSIQLQNFFEFKTIFEYKCKMNGIELRIVDRFYPSSKTCSQCGNIKKDLKLKDRIYKCDCCGLVIDRDLNASINLFNTNEYKIA